MKRNATTTRKFKDYTHLFDIDPNLARFRQKLVIHPVFEECEETILAKIAHPASFNIVSVVGPSGAGKTQLLNEVTGSLLCVGPSPQPPAEPGQKEKPPYLPNIFVVAKNGRTFESRYRSLLIEILEYANEVLVTIGKTIPSGIIEPPKFTKSELPLVAKEFDSISKLPISRLEALVRSALKERKVRAVLIDEAQHLVPSEQQHNGYIQDMRLIADGLKLLGNAGTLIVLFGTAELLTLPNLTAQLGRRSQLIHFRRYRWQDPADQHAFQWVVEQFVESWPIVLPKALLLAQLPFLYAGCLGCIGILADWLAAAMNRAGSGSVTMDILKQTALRRPRLRKIQTEALQCETAFAEEEFGPEDLIKEVCGDDQNSTTSGSTGGTGSNGSAQNGANGKAKKQHKLKPGHRRQKYDTFVPSQRKASI